MLNNICCLYISLHAVQHCSTSILLFLNAQDIEVFTCLLYLYMEYLNISGIFSRFSLTSNPDNHIYSIVDCSFTSSVVLV